jgi:hypothetical protein
MAMGCRSQTCIAVSTCTAHSTTLIPLLYVVWCRWAYNHNTKEVGGLVGADWKTLDWKKLSWMQGNLGLTPWYKKGGAAAAAAPPAAAASNTSAPK